MVRFAKISLALGFLLALAAVAVHAEKSAKAPVRVKALVESFLLAEPSEREPLIKRLEAEKIGPEALRLAVAEVPKEKPAEGKLLEAKVKAGGRDYSFFYAVPENYDEKGEYPLLVSLTYSYGTPDLARQMYENYWHKAVEKGWIVLQLPTRDKVLFFKGGGDVILPAVRWAFVKLAVDPGRVWLCGASYGGIGAFWFAARRGDLFGACVVYPGALTVKGRKPLMNLKRIPFLLWHGENDHPVWGEREKKVAKRLEKAGTTAELMVGKGMGHLPDPASDTIEKFIAFLAPRKRTPVPPSCSWYFFDPAFPYAHGVEILEGEYPLRCDVTRKPGEVAVSVPAGVSLRLFLSPADLKDGKVTVTLNGDKVFSGAPPEGLRSACYAAYEAVWGAPWRWSLVLGGEKR